MSKKLYLEPEMDVIEIKYSGVLCASDPISDDGKTETGEDGDEDDF